jgi:hypothetical protein
MVKRTRKTLVWDEQDVWDPEEARDVEAELAKAQQDKTRPEAQLALLRDLASYIAHLKKPKILADANEFASYVSICMALRPDKSRNWAIERMSKMYGISRKNAYDWIERLEKLSPPR